MGWIRCASCREEYNSDVCSQVCPHPVRSEKDAAQQQQMASLNITSKQQVRIIMEGGSFMDLEPPPDFQFAALVQSIRAMDHFMNGKVYIPGDKILAIILWDATNPPVTVNAPSTETKQ